MALGSPLSSLDSLCTKFILHSRGYRCTVSVSDEKQALGAQAKSLGSNLVNWNRSKNACKDLTLQFPAFSSCRLTVYANISLPARPKHKTQRNESESTKGAFLKNLLPCSSLPDLLEQTRMRAMNVKEILQDRQNLVGFVFVLTFTLVGKYLFWCVNILLNQITSRITTLASPPHTHFLFWAHLTKLLRLVLN